MNTGNISIKASVSGNTPGLKGEKGNGIKSTVLNDDYSLTFNYTNGTSDTTPPIRGQKGEKGDNGISPSITTSKSGKVTTITIKDATGTKTATINDGIDGQGDMLKSTYDKNSNGIVDNSEKVNGYTVETNVPSDAKFTDTIYTHPDTSGNKHIPSGGVSGQILKWDEDGTAKWDDSVEAHREGTELKINNYKGLIKFTKEGKTEQKTYTGKNILDYVSNLKASSDGLTNVINDDGSITTTGKPNLNYTYIINGRDITDELENGETYTLSQTLASNKLYAQIDLRKKDGTYTYLSANLDNRKHISFKVDKTIYENYSLKIQTGTISSWGDSSLTITNKYMLCKGTDTADSSFEPYVGGTQSPNPDYPQKIENIKGVENLIKDYYIDKDSAQFKNILYAHLDLKPNSTYTLSFSGKVGNKIYCNENLFSQVTITVIDGINIMILKTKSSLDKSNVFQYDSNYGWIILKNYKGNTVVPDFENIMINEGSTIHDFVPYGSNYLQLKNVKKNLFDKNNLHFILGAVDVESITINNVGKSFYIKCKPNTTYTISRKIVGSRFVVGTTNGIPKQGEKVYDRVVNNAGSSITLTTSSNSNYLCVYYLLNSTENENNILDNIQIEEGSESTSYEQYQEKIINVDLKGNNLCSNKDKSVKDELLVENVKAKIYKKIKEVVLDGSENWFKSGSSNSSRFVASLEITNIMKTKTFNALCNYFTYNIEFDIAKFHLFNTNTDGTARFIAFGVDASTISDLTQWKAFLKSLYDSGNPVRVQYELAEPEVIDLGEVDFDLIENSTLTCEEESNMQIDYLTISSNIFVQDSLDGSSSQKAPSIDAVNKAINKISNYSSEEQCIGEWFGEKHYRKVFKIDMDSTSKEMTIPTGIVMKQLTHAYGVALYNGTIYLPLNFYNNLGWDSFHLTEKGANIILQRGDNFSITKVFITLEYTKNV